MFLRGYEALREKQGPTEDEEEGEELKRIPSQGALRYVKLLVNIVKVNVCLLFLSEHLVSTYIFYIMF